VLYALAAERMLSAKAASGRLFYCTQRGNYTECPIEINEDSRRYFARGMALIDDAIASGFLPAAPDKGACALCEFSVVCGPHEEVRVRWKDSEALVKLNQLRSMP
jgi:ATP-dependent helicase/nuclease subunit B